MAPLNNLDIKKNFFVKDYYVVKDDSVVKKKLNIFQRIVRKIFGVYKKTHLKRFLTSYNRINHTLSPESRTKIENYLNRINKINAVVRPIINNIGDSMPNQRVRDADPGVGDENPRVVAEEPEIVDENPGIVADDPILQDDAPIIEVIISDEKRAFVYDFVEQFLTPYLKGQITKETDSVDREPMIELLYNQMPELIPAERKKIETIALDAYFSIAAESAVRRAQIGEEGRFIPLTHESPNFQLWVNALTEALPKDFPDLAISEEDIAQKAQNSIETANRVVRNHFKNLILFHDNRIGYMDEEEGVHQRIHDLTLSRLWVFKKRKELFLSKGEIDNPEENLKFQRRILENIKLTKRLSPEKTKDDECIDRIYPIKIDRQERVDLVKYYNFDNLSLNNVLKILVDEILDFENLLEENKNGVENIERYEEIISQEKEYLNTIIENYIEVKVKENGNEESLTVIESREELYVNLNSKYTVKKIEQRYEKKLKSVLGRRGLKKASKSSDSPLLSDVKRKAANLANYVKSHRIERIEVIQARMEEKLERKAFPSEVDAKIYGLALRTYFDIYQNETLDKARVPKWGYALPDYEGRGAPTPHCKLLGDNQIFYSHYYHKPSDSYESIYMVGEQIGKGGFNTAYEVLILDDDYPKTSVLRQMTDNTNYMNASEWDNEAKIHDDLIELDIPGIIPFSYTIEQSTPLNGYRRAMITRKKCDGDLTKVQSGQLEETERVSAMKQSLRTIRKMHENDYAHGDLKPENILYKIKNGKIKTYVADFGGTKKIGNLRGASDLRYMRYDQMTNPLANVKDDIWALALTAFKLKYDENHWFSKAHKEIAAGVVELSSNGNFLDQWVVFILNNPHQHSPYLYQGCVNYTQAKQWGQPVDTTQLKNYIVQEVYGHRLKENVAALRNELGNSDDSYDRMICYLMDLEGKKIKLRTAEKILNEKD